jgi:hypothetical protein
MNHWRLAAALAVSLLASPALAQPSSPPAPSARALELSHRLIVAVHLTDTFDSVMQNLMPQLIDMRSKQIQGFRPEWRQALIEASQEAGDDMMAQLAKQAEPIYAQTFTEDELSQAVAFYESPTGQSMIKKTPQITPLLMKNFQGLSESMQADMMARFCKKIGGCDKAGPAPDKPSGS